MATPLEFFQNAFGPNGVMEPREALRIYQVLANEHVARYPDRPDLVPFKVTLQDLIARRDANRAAASMTSDAGNSLAQEANNDGQSDDDEEDEDED